MCKNLSKEKHRKTYTREYTHTQIHSLENKKMLVLKEFLKAKGKRNIRKGNNSYCKYSFHMVRASYGDKLGFTFIKETDLLKIKTLI